MQRILGVDPGSRITGVGIIECDGSQAKMLMAESLHLPGDDVPQRLYSVYEKLHEIIVAYQPTQASIEQVFMYRNPGSALKLGQARGAALVAIASHALPIAEYAPRLIKQAVVGYGAADKSQVAHMVKQILQLAETPAADAADALAIALCHWQMGSSERAMLLTQGRRRKSRSSNWLRKLTQ